MQPAPHGGTLDQWLGWLEQLDPNRITPGLERVLDLGQRMGVLKPCSCVISIAGTNGKGSSATLLEQTLTHAGYHVAVYSSPHLLTYNERLRLDGRDVDSETLCRAFEQVARYQGDIPLSYFEFGTLAVFWIIHQQAVDVAILEVGLGGRLDAVNAVDADYALITSIGLDHQDWLGHDREAIGREKAGIMRGGRPVVCNDLQPPTSISEVASERGAHLYMAGRDFQATEHGRMWAWSGMERCHNKLPRPAIPGAVYRHNAAGVLAVLECLSDDYPWRDENFRYALQAWQLPARAQRLDYAGRELWLDVAHNEEAAAALAQILGQDRSAGRTLAVFAVLKGKPVAAMMQALQAQVDHWCLAGLQAQPRGMHADELVEFARQAGLQYDVSPEPRQAWQVALQASKPGDRLVILGSFHTVQAVVERINSKETEHG